MALNFPCCAAFKGKVGNSSRKTLNHCRNGLGLVALSSKEDVIEWMLTLTQDPKIEPEGALQGFEALEKRRFLEVPTS